MLRPYKGIQPRVAADAYVDASAQVIGDVEIGPESSIWMNVVIRGDVNTVRIGRRTNIQDGSIVHVMRETHPTRGPRCAGATAGAIPRRGTTARRSSVC